jgi:hypothetical protein
MFSSYHYEYLRRLVTLDEDVNGANMGNSTRLDSFNFLGHELCLPEIHVGR